MSSHNDAQIQAAMDSQTAVHDAEEAIKKAREDSDPQTVFYLNPTSTAVTKLDELDDLTDDLQITKYNWATKIEQTVQKMFGEDNPKKRHAIQLSWDRASYRARLVDFMTRTTPWFIQAIDHNEDPSNQKLTGDYYHDKLVYQKAAHDYLRQKIREVPGDRLQVIEKYIAETLALSQDKLKDIQRFAVVFPSVDKNGPLIQPALRTVTLNFERKKDDKGNLEVEISKTVYQAKVNKKLFDQQKFDQKMLDIGTPLVKEWTLDVRT